MSRGSRIGIGTNVWTAWICGVFLPGETGDGLNDLGAQGQSEQAGPFVAKLAAGAEVVDLGHVAGRPQQEADRQAGVLVMPAQGLSQVINIIGRESVSPHDGQVAGEIDKDPEQLAAGSPGRQHADVGVDRAGRLDDVGIPLAGMGGLAAVAHQETAVEADAGLVADPVAQLGGMQRVISGDDGLGDLRAATRSTYSGSASDSKQVATGPPPCVWLAPIRTCDAGDLGGGGDRLRGRGPWPPR